MKLKKRLKKRTKNEYKCIRNFSCLVLLKNEQQRTIKFDFIKGGPMRTDTIITYKEAKDLINELAIVLK